MLTTLSLEDELRSLIPFTGLYDHSFETLYIQKEYYTPIPYRGKWYFLKHRKSDIVEYDLLPLGPNINENILMDYPIRDIILSEEWKKPNSVITSEDYIYSTTRDDLKDRGYRYKELSKSKIYDVFKILYQNRGKTPSNFILPDGEGPYNSGCILLKKAFTFDVKGILVYEGDDITGCLIGYPINKGLFMGYIYEYTDENYEHLFSYFCDYIKKLGYTEINMADNPTSIKDSLQPNRRIARYV